MQIRNCTPGSVPPFLPQSLRQSVRHTAPNYIVCLGWEKVLKVKEKKCERKLKGLDVLFTFFVESLPAPPKMISQVVRYFVAESY